MGWLTLKLFYGTTDNYSEETRYMWTLAVVREYAQMVFNLNNQEFALHLMADHKKINTDRELWIAWRPYWTRSGDARLHLKVVAAPAAPLAPESSVVVGGVVGGVVVVGIRI